MAETADDDRLEADAGAEDADRLARDPRRMSQQGVTEAFGHGPAPVVVDVNASRHVVLDVGGHPGMVEIKALYAASGDVEREP